MPQTPEKKFLSFGNRTYTVVRGTRWYVEYYRAHEDRPGIMVRHRAYGQINRIKDLEARELAAVKLIERLEGELPQSKTSVLEDTLEAMRGALRYKTYMTYRSKVRGWRAWLKVVPDQTATGAQAKTFISDLAAKRSTACVKSYRDTLHSLYLRAGLSSPFAGVKTAKKVSKSMKPFSEAQSSAILAMAKERSPLLWLSVQLLYYCFIRPGEQRALRVEDIDLDRGCIELRSELSKNKKTQQVSIPTAFVTVLAAELDGRRSGLLLSRTGRMMAHSYLYKQHKAILQALDIKGRYSLYSWKHTGVVRAVRAGIGIKDLQLQLRHYSLDMVNEYLKDLGVLDSDDLRGRFPSI